MQPPLAQDVQNGYPLGLEAQRLEIREVEFSAGPRKRGRCCTRAASHSRLCADFLRHIFPKLDWRVLRDAAVRCSGLAPPALAGRALTARSAQETLGLSGLPMEVQPDMLESDTFLKAFHHVLLEVHVEEGALICPESGHRFVIRHACFLVCTTHQTVASAWRGGRGPGGVYRSVVLWACEWPPWMASIGHAIAGGQTFYLCQLLPQDATQWAQHCELSSGMCRQ